MIGEFKDAHRPVWAACAAEPECILLDVFQDPEQPGRFRLVEVWDATRKWFETGQPTKPCYATPGQRSKPTWEKEWLLSTSSERGRGAATERGIWMGEY